MSKGTSKTKGVHCTFQAFCKPCGWQGSHWLGEGAAKNAHAEYRWHKDQQSHKDRENSIAQEVLESKGNIANPPQTPLHALFVDTLKRMTFIAAKRPS